jgi:hypothetical protein
MENFAIPDIPLPGVSHHRRSADRERRWSMPPLKSAFQSPLFERRAACRAHKQAFFGAS